MERALAILVFASVMLDLLVMVVTYPHVLVNQSVVAQEPVLREVWCVTVIQPIQMQSVYQVCIKILNNTILFFIHQSINKLESMTGPVKKTI